MAKKRKTVRKTTKKHFKAPWWKLFFVVAAAAFIAIPVANQLNLGSESEEVLGEKNSNSKPVKQVKYIVDIDFWVFNDKNGNGIWDNKKEEFIPKQQINVSDDAYGIKQKMFTNSAGLARFHYEEIVDGKPIPTAKSIFAARLFPSANYKSTTLNPVSVKTKVSQEYEAKTQTKIYRRTALHDFGVVLK